MSFKIAILGRPNVGKSTLFNRLVGRKEALVDDIPGLTRDRKEAQASLGDLHFTLIDTAGLERAENASMESLMMEQTFFAAEEADLIIMMIDGREGLVPADEEFGRRIRKMNKPTFLIANKCEGKKISPGLSDAHRLGLGNPLPLSAEHGIGLNDLYDTLIATQAKYAFDKTADEEIDEEIIQISIVGRPNVGKSTFLNALIKENRSIASDIAGTTRDSVYVDWEYKGQPVKLVDTAGLRKRSKRHERLEKLSVNDSFKAIQYSNIVVLMLDATQAFEKMDMTLFDHIVNEGRGMVLALNKWDKVKDKKATLANVEEKLEFILTQARGIPVVTLSALDGQNVERVIDKCLTTFALWNKRVSTGKLNRWLQDTTAAHIPPLSKGRRINFKYMTQAKARPPTFIIFTSSNTNDLPESYIRYLKNSLQETFQFDGIPIRILVRKKENPFDK